MTIELKWTRVRLALGFLERWQVVVPTDADRRPRFMVEPV